MTYFIHKIHNVTWGILIFCLVSCRAEDNFKVNYWTVVSSENEFVKLEIDTIVNCGNFLSNKFDYLYVNFDTLFTYEVDHSYKVMGFDCYILGKGTFTFDGKPIDVLRFSLLYEGVDVIYIKLVGVVMCRYHSDFYKMLNRYVYKNKNVRKEINLEPFFEEVFNDYEFWPKNER